jgi:hypothetical protein
MYENAWNNEVCMIEESARKPTEIYDDICRDIYKYLHRIIPDIDTHPSGSSIYLEKDGFPTVIMQIRNSDGVYRKVSLLEPSGASSYAAIYPEWKAAEVLINDYPVELGGELDATPQEKELSDKAYLNLLEMVKRWDNIGYEVKTTSVPTTHSDFIKSQQKQGWQR